MSAAQSDTTTRPATLRDSTPTSRARRVVLVGTAQTIPGLRAIIAHATEAVGGIEAAGVVLLGDVGPVLESDLPVVSSLEHLAELCERVGATEAVVSRPAAASSLTERLRSLMRRLGVDATFVPTTDELLNASRAVPARFPPAPRQSEFANLFGARGSDRIGTIRLALRVADAYDQLWTQTIMSACVFASRCGRSARTCVWRTRRWRP